MTHRYNFTVNQQWRRAQLRKVATETAIALSKQIRANGNAALILLAIYGAGLYVGIDGKDERPAYITAIIIAGAIIGFVSVIRYALVIKDRVRMKERLRTDFQMLGDKLMPPDWTWLCDTLERLYESKEPYTKELFLLVMHAPETINISHVPGNDTLAIRYAYKTADTPNPTGYATRTFTCGSDDFFSMVDAGKASINLLGEVVDGKLIHAGT